jgi:hypothetical protein
MYVKQYISGAVLALALVSSTASAGWLDKLGGLLGSKDDSSNATSNAASSVLTNADIGGAFKQALELGSQRVVEQLSVVDGFNNDPVVHIPLPKQLNDARRWLDKVNMTQHLDDLELKLNRAAEEAMPQAKTLFVDAIKQMTFDDVRAIYNGPQDSATRYFQAKMTPTLRDAMAPVVSSSLSEVGAIKRYDDTMAEYRAIPFVPDIKADLVGHVVQKGLEGMFYYLAQEEAAIRRDPLKRTTELLQQVFGK